MKVLRLNEKRYYCQNQCLKPVPDRYRIRRPNTQFVRIAEQVRPLLEEQARLLSFLHTQEEAAKTLDLASFYTTTRRNTARQLEYEVQLIGRRLTGQETPEEYLSFVKETRPDLQVVILSDLQHQSVGQSISKGELGEHLASFFLRPLIASDVSSETLEETKEKWRRSHNQAMQEILFGLDLSKPALVVGNNLLQTIHEDIHRRQFEKGIFWLQDYRAYTGDNEQEIEDAQMKLRANLASPSWEFSAGQLTDRERQLLFRETLSEIEVNQWILKHFSHLKPIFPGEFYGQIDYGAKYQMILPSRFSPVN